MVWRSDGPQGNESAKVAFDVVEYLRGRVLDLGCGPRKVFPGKHIVGVDSDKDRQLFGISSVADEFCDCAKLDIFADGSADCIFSSHLLEHLDDPKAALRRWWEVLKVGGTLVLYLPHRDHYPNIGMPGSNPDHKHDFLPEDVTLMMKDVAWRSGQGWTQERNETRTDGDEYSFLQVYRKRATAGTAEYEDKPRPRGVGVVRLGAFGDALWITTVLPQLREKYGHVTLYTQPEGEQSLLHDPNVDRMVVQEKGIFGNDDKTALIQWAYWLHLEKKHDHFINLVGSVERQILPHQADPNFYLPADQRRRLFNRNYYEAVAEWAGVKFDAAKVQVKFTPSEDELLWAFDERAKFAGPVVVINPSGSSMPKWWPYTQRAMELFDAAGVHTVVLGDLRGAQIKDTKLGRVIGKDWPIRKAYAFAARADVVIGTESAIINSVAHEAPLKIVLLSHSTPNNLTRDWDRTIAVEPEGLHCYPCHRIHQDMSFCTMNQETKAAACQSAATAETIVEWALQWIRGEMKEAA